MVVARKRTRQLVQGRSHRELWLRVVGSERDGQVIRLSSPKCTIGSARGCTLRLRAAGVRPIHCLILRGAQGTVARTCPEGARLNGQEFLDAALAQGDRLEVGPVTLEVIPSPDAGDEEAVERDPADSELEDDSVRSERIRVVRQRARKLVQAVRTVRSEMALLRQQSAEEQSLRAGERELDRQRWIEEHEQSAADWHTQRQEWETAREHQRAELDRTKAESDAAWAELQTQREHLQVQRLELAQLYQSGHGEIEQLRTLLDNDRQAWSELQQQQEESLQQQAAQLQAAQEELAAREAALVDSTTQHEQHRDELRQAQTGLEEARAELERAHHALDRARAEVEHDRAQLHDRKEALARERAEFDAEQQVLADSRAELAHSQAEIAAGFEQLLHGHEALEASRQQFAERERGLVSREESNEARHGDVNHQRAAWAIELVAWESIQAAAHDQLRQQHADLVAREQALADRAQVAELQDAQAHAARDESLQAERDEFARQCQQEESRLAERANQLEQQAAQLEQERQQLRIEREATSADPPPESQAATADLEALLNETQQRLALQQQQLDETLSQCASLSSELEQLRGEYAARQAEFEEQRAARREPREACSAEERNESASAETAMEEASEELEQLRATLSELANDEFDEEATVKMEPAATQEIDALRIEPVDDDEYDAAGEEWRERLRATGAAGESEDDKSIEQCFEELLNRYRKQGAEPAPVAPVKRGKRKSDQKAAQPPREPQRPAPVNLLETVEIPVVDLMTPPAEIQKRSSGIIPNFSAMREVAVSHANLAIGAHGRKRLVRAALLTSSAALGAVLVTLVLMAALAHHYTGLRTLANVGWVLAIFWAFVASKAWRQVAAANQADAEGLRENLERLGRNNS